MDCTATPGGPVRSTTQLSLSLTPTPQGIITSFTYEEVETQKGHVQSLTLSTGEARF